MIGVAFGLTWSRVGLGRQGYLAPLVFGVAVIAIVYAYARIDSVWLRFRRWRRGEELSETALATAREVPLAVTDPYLQVRAYVVSDRTVVNIDGTARDVALVPRNWISRPLGEEQKTGDVGFDARVRVQGSTLTCRALLDADVRGRYLAALEELPGLRVENGAVTWSTRRRLSDDDIRRIAETMVALARSFVPPNPLAELKKHVLTERVAAVRLRALELLIGRFPEAPETREAVAGAVADADGVVRLKAALVAGSAGHQAIVALAGDDTLAIDRRVEAVRGLAQVDPASALDPIRKALKDRRDGLRVAAIQTAARLKLAEVCPLLGALAPRASREIQNAIVHAVVIMGDLRGESALLALLDEKEAPAVHLLAVNGLASIGTVRAIERLVPFRDQLFAGDLGRSAAESILQIQSRIGGADRGQLTVAPGTGGSLSMPMHEQGAVTMVDERGKVSLAKRTT